MRLQFHPHQARIAPKAANIVTNKSIGGLSNMCAEYLYYDAPRYGAVFGGVKSSLETTSRESLNP